MLFFHTYVPTIPIYVCGYLELSTFFTPFILLYICTWFIRINTSSLITASFCVVHWYKSRWSSGKCILVKFKFRSQSNDPELQHYNYRVLKKEMFSTIWKNFLAYCNGGVLVVNSEVVVGLAPGKNMNKNSLRWNLQQGRRGVYWSRLRNTKHVQP
jgi:hypothetical protein